MLQRRDRSNMTPRKTIMPLGVPLPAAIITTARIRRPTITITGTRAIVAASKTKAFAELPLLLWLSPAFPVGAFAYSHGLEWAVAAGDITDAASLGGWLRDLLDFGAPR